MIRLRDVPLPQRVAGAVVLVGTAAVGFVPLFGGPGYEHALASGVLVPSATAIAVALDGSIEAREPSVAVGRGLATGAALAGLAFLTALLHGLRVGMCDLPGGALLFALTAGMGSLLAGVWGAIVAERCRGRKRRRTIAVLLALSAPLAGVVVSVARFYGSPMVFGYDPFFGYFSGALYDTVVDVRMELWTYRAGTAATLAGAVLLAGVMRRTPAGLSLAAVRESRAAAVRAATGLALLVLSAVSCLEGPTLGHWQTAASIAHELGGAARGTRCDVVYPDTLRADQVALLVRDCEEELAADERRLGTHLSGRLTAFVFRDADQKRRLMGAADTQIAKPWRREVYVQMTSYPHPVLGHEVAHVVAGALARGPFRVAGGLGGLWPNPGLIEGTAEAASPDDDELTDAQWARAMLDLGILPDLRSLFSISFMGENSSKGYTVAAAFVGWVLERWGAPVLGAWYGGASLEGLTGEPWDALSRDFDAWLHEKPMPPEASAYARARFDRPSVWGRRCPHVVDALDRRADKCRDEHALERAETLYGAALARDPHDWHALLDRARIETTYGDEAAGRDALGKVASDEHAPRTWRDRALEALADDDLARGRDAPAATVYRDLAARVLDEDAARTAEVKALSLDNPPARRAIVDLLVGEPGRPLDSWLGALSLGAWAEETHEPLAGYLIGKNLALKEDWARAATWLDRALDGGVPTPRVGRELLRQRAIVACATRDAEGQAFVRRRLDDEASPFSGSAGGRRAWIVRLLDRCAAQNR